jgi:hypothetical protein
MTQVLRLSLPITLWLIGFCAIYGLQGLSCSRHWPPGLEDPRAVLLAAAGLFVLMQGIVLLAVLRVPDPSRFVQRTAAILAAVAFAAAVWTVLPALAVSVCG